MSFARLRVYYHSGVASAIRIRDPKPNLEHSLRRECGTVDELFSPSTQGPQFQAPKSQMPVPGRGF